MEKQQLCASQPIPPRGCICALFRSCGRGSRCRGRIRSGRGGSRGRCNRSIDSGRRWLRGLCPLLCRFGALRAGEVWRRKPWLPLYLGRGIGDVETMPLRRRAATQAADDSSAPLHSALIRGSCQKMLEAETSEIPEPTKSSPGGSGPQAKNTRIHPEVGQTQ